MNYINHCLHHHIFQKIIIFKFKIFKIKKISCSKLVSHIDARFCSLVTTQHALCSLFSCLSWCRLSTPARPNARVVRVDTTELRVGLSSIHRPLSSDRADRYAHRSALCSVLSSHFSRRNGQHRQEPALQRHRGMYMLV
jgi:hypothetical protein